MITETLLRGLEKCAAHTLGYETEDLSPVEAVSVLHFYEASPELETKEASGPYVSQVTKRVSAASSPAKSTPRAAVTSSVKRVTRPSPGTVAGAPAGKSAVGAPSKGPQAVRILRSREKTAEATKALLKYIKKGNEKRAEGGGGGAPAAAPAAPGGTGSYAPQDTYAPLPGVPAGGTPRDVLSREARIEEAENKVATSTVPAGSGPGPANRARPVPGQDPLQGRVNTILGRRAGAGPVNRPAPAEDGGSMTLPFPWWMALPAGLGAVVGGRGLKNFVGKGVRRSQALRSGGMRGVRQQIQDEKTEAITKGLKGMHPKAQQSILKDVGKTTGTGGMFSQPFRNWGTKEWALAGGAGLMAPAAAKGVSRIVHGEPEQKKSLF